MERASFSLGRQAPASAENFDPEHLSRDGGTPRAEALRSFYIPHLSTICLVFPRTTYHASTRQPSDVIFARYLNKKIVFKSK
jgi:hypothetical protein